MDAWVKQHTDAILAQYNRGTDPNHKIYQDCYVLVECSTQCELDGYNFNALHIVLQAYTSDLCESRWFMGIGVVQGCEGVGDVPGV